MSLDRSFVEENRLATQRIRDLAARLTEAEMQHPVGEHWTVAVTLAHIAFWEQRVLFSLNQTEKAGKLSFVDLDLTVNDMLLPFWAAISPHDAAKLAIESAEIVDQRLESFPPGLLEAIYDYYPRAVFRSRHRNAHLDEAEAALKQ